MPINPELFTIYNPGMNSVNLQLGLTCYVNTRASGMEEII
jgi:hypothetical protein